VVYSFRRELRLMPDLTILGGDVIESGGRVRQPQTSAIRALSQKAGK
jgi:hypothetical protein